MSVFSFNVNLVLTFVGCCLVPHCFANTCRRPWSQKDIQAAPYILSPSDDQIIQIPFFGFSATVRVNGNGRLSLVEEWYHTEKKMGFVGLKADGSDGMDRRYFIHPDNELLVERDRQCLTENLTRENKLELIQSWLEPMDLFKESSIFEKLDQGLGPSLLMIYAHSISREATHSRTMDENGQSIDQWSYCYEDGRIVNFSFYSETANPREFSMKSGNSKYDYWFETFGPLIVSSSAPSYEIHLKRLECRNKEIPGSEAMAYNMGPENQLSWLSSAIKKLTIACIVLTSIGFVSLTAGFVLAKIWNFL